MKEESLLLLSDLQKLINQVVLIDYTIIILGGSIMVSRKEEIAKKLEDAIVKNLDDANDMETGQDREATYKVSMDLIKTRESMDSAEKAEAKEKQEAEAKAKETIWRHVIDICEIAMPVGAYFVVSAMGFNLEKTGYLGGKTLQNALRSIRPKK